MLLKSFFFINVSESVLDQWREGGVIIQLLSANYLKIHKHMLGQCQFYPRLMFSWVVTTFFQVN